jgi:hypothetical protein
LLAQVIEEEAKTRQLIADDGARASVEIDQLLEGNGSRTGWKSVLRFRGLARAMFGAQPV